MNAAFYANGQMANRQIGYEMKNYFSNYVAEQEPEDMFLLTCFPPDTMEGKHE